MDLPKLKFGEFQIPFPMNQWEEGMAGTGAIEHLLGGGSTEKKITTIFTTKYKMNETIIIYYYVMLP